MRRNPVIRNWWRPIVFLALVSMAAPALADHVLSCENQDNAEGGCCCYRDAHTYRFDPVRVERLRVAFDTGGGLGCRSEVRIQALTRRGWLDLRTVDAISSSGRSETYRLGGRFELREVVSAVRISDGGRCHIDFSEVRLEVDPEGPTRPPASGRPGGLTTGTYPVRVESDRTYESTWELRVSGREISGSSHWDCCPGKRTDPLRGKIEGDRVTLVRDCRRRGFGERCRDVFEGRVAGRYLKGSFERNGEYAGKWSLDLGPGPAPPPEEPEPFGVEIVATSPPPYKVSSTIVLRQEPRPVPGARWFLDGEAVSDAASLRWRFREIGTHRVALRARDGEVLDSFRIEVDADGVYRLEGKQVRTSDEARRDARTGVRNENRELVLDRSTRVVKVEGNAQRYCIWTLTEYHEIGERVVCGGEEDPLTGALLLPGRYVVFPALAEHQRYCEVTIYLRRR